MTTEMAIRVENVGKRYLLGKAHAHDRISELLHYAPKTAYRLARRCLPGRSVMEAPDPSARLSSNNKEFWALRDVSFEVPRGTVLGVVGRNGAGKSTLFKLLSRTIEPTTGRYGVDGRIGSLLEVGTGFHPELTGRENVFLSGTILGMTKAEIRKEFDEIVDFANIDDFLDTPVKRYSSGMYVRLGFAIAAHLRPEILIIDEVLAVGDAQFQKKCIGKMSDVAKSGRTILFVSHNMTSVSRLCNQCVMLENGRVAKFGSTHDVLEEYSLRTSDTVSVEEQLALLPDDPHIELLDIQVMQNGVARRRIQSGETTTVHIDCRVKQLDPRLRVSIAVHADDDSPTFMSYQDSNSDASASLEVGVNKLKATIPASLLAPLRYQIRVGATIFGSHSCTGDNVSIPLEVEQSGPIDNSQGMDIRAGDLWPAVAWESS